MIPQFKDEHKFIKWLEDALDGSRVKRGRSYPDTGEKGNPTIRASSEVGDRKSGEIVPDITLSHDIYFEISHPHRRKVVTPPTEPAYIECKIGTAYREEGEIATERSDTGIPEIQRELNGQLKRYQYKSSTAQPTDASKNTVFVTCPYMLDVDFHKNHLLDFSVAQFEQTLRSHNLGWVYRNQHGIVLQLDSNNSYLVPEP